MTTNYEIVVLEDNNLTLQEELTENVMEHYLNTCRYYINPSHVGKNYIKVSDGKMFIKYSDRTRSVMLLGITTPEMVVYIKEKLRKFYYKNCTTCNVEISLFWTLCDKCKKT